MPEPVVAETARCLLDALAMAGGIGMGVELRHMEGYTIVGSEGFDEGFIAVAIAGAQMEIAMGDGKGIAGRMHEMGKNHRVDTPANGQQHLLPCGEEVLPGYVGYEVSVHLLDNHLAHAAFAVVLNAIVVDSGGEIGFVEGDGVAAFVVGGGALIEGAAYKVGDEEAR